MESGLFGRLAICIIDLLKAQHDQTDHIIN